MEYEWYADVFLLTNLLMDMSAMFAAALLLNDRLRLGRCLAVCAAGEQKAKGGFCEPF